jgi:Zn-finger nucleic acid-binding protein
LRACPVCSSPMTQETHDGVQVDACHDHGLWLDKKELFEITERERRDGKGVGLLGLFARLHRPGGDPNRSLNCPLCGEGMTLDRYHDVQIDHCIEHGVWLDSGELEAILHNLKLDPLYMGGISLRLSDLKY